MQAGAFGKSSFAPRSILVCLLFVEYFLKWDFFSAWDNRSVTESKSPEDLTRPYPCSGFFSLRYQVPENNSPLCTSATRSGCSPARPAVLGGHLSSTGNEKSSLGLARGLLGVSGKSAQNSIDISRLASNHA